MPEYTPRYFVVVKSSSKEEERIVSTFALRLPLLISFLSIWKNNAQGRLKDDEKDGAFVTSVSFAFLRDRHGRFRGIFVFLRLSGVLRRKDTTYCVYKMSVQELWQVWIHAPRP